MSIELHIALSNVTGQAVPVGSVYAKADGTKARRFIRAIAKIGGTYRKPSWKAVEDDAHLQNGVLTCSAEFVGEVLGNAAAFAADGISSKATKNHDDWKDAAKTMGDQQGFFVDDGWLKCETEILGEENIKIAEANREVSADFCRNYSINGKTYKGWSIPAVSFVPNPLVSGQTRLAASADDPPVLSLEEPTMKSVLAALSLSADATEAQALAAVTALQGKATAAETRLSLSVTPESNTEVLDTRREVASELILSLSTGNNPILSPAVAKELEAELCGTKDKPAKLCLSKTAADGSTTLARRVYDILKANIAVATGKKTGEQDGKEVALNASAEDDGTEKPLTPERLAELRAEAGLPPKK